MRRTPIRVEASVEQLLASASGRTAWKNADSLSGSTLERVTVDATPHVVKYVCVDDDWIMRGTGDLHCRQYDLYASALLDSLPDPIDHSVIACAPYMSSQGHRGCAILMEDVGALMIPAGSDVIPHTTHRRLLGSMASIHAAFWGWHDDIGLLPLSHHFLFLTPVMSTLEAERGSSDPVPPAVASGWAAMSRQHPEQADALGRLAHDPSPLLRALSATPHTFIHGDWKLGNLGERENGRTILLDWDRCGQGPACTDLAWYLAVNCDRLPESKEDTITAYRDLLESHGVATQSWWHAQLSAALVGAFLQLGWAKTGDPVEFDWWSGRLREGLLLL